MLWEKKKKKSKSLVQKMKQSRKDQFGVWRCLERRVGEDEASTGIVRHQEGFVPGWMGGMGASSEAELTTWPVKLADPERSRKEDKKYTEQRESMCWVIHSQSKAASFPECLEFLKGKSPPLPPPWLNTWQCHWAVQYQWLVWISSL